MFISKTKPELLQSYKMGVEMFQARNKMVKNKREQINKKEDIKTRWNEYFSERE